MNADHARRALAALDLRERNGAAERWYANFSSERLRAEAQHFMSRADAAPREKTHARLFMVRALLSVVLHRLIELGDDDAACTLEGAYNFASSALFRLEQVHVPA